MGSVSNLIIKDLGSNEYVVRCGFCQGVGRSPRKTADWKIVTSAFTCDVCSGRGMMRVRTDDLIIPDAGCNGTGLAHANHDGFSTAYKCHECNGVGARSLSGKLVVVT